MSKTPCSVLNSKIRGKKVYLPDDDESLISTALSLVWTKTDKKIDSCTFEQDRVRMSYKKNEGRIYFDLEESLSNFTFIDKDITNQLNAIYHSKIIKYQEQLIYYLAHQTRKAYLNAQFNIILHELNDWGAIIITTQKDHEKLDIQAHDHWSSDTKQDVWFIASCFEAVFLTINPKPH
ncbi:hypothetical protein GLOIN_2v1781828 [Rhizophagus clarus]|uniref:Uncharacterized protein n=1 Tax=Rhizophagus clarus TaxID=94130 RepID=A0A8H3KZA3_9GLOM|nr:hypothetical protein GLOIN_2v1781828 [Rhizophagus clarus]